MAELKTKPTKVSVDKFIKSQPNAQVREDCAVISKLMSEATGEKPQMWGPSMSASECGITSTQVGAKVTGPYSLFLHANRI